MTLVYIAGQWKDRNDIRALAEKLEEKGHTITAKWYNDTTINVNKTLEWLKDSEVEKRFKRDFNACDDALYFILYLGDAKKLCGCLVELGIAYTLDYGNKRFIAIGNPIKSVLMYGIDVWYDSFDDMFKNEKWIYHKLNKVGKKDEKGSKGLRNRG